MPFFGLQGVGQPGQILNDFVVQVARNALAFQVGGIDGMLQKSTFRGLVTLDSASQAYGWNELSQLQRTEGQ